jgi:beta-fructofuranosidase
VEKPPRRRPGVHFAPKANWMNDPNGLIFWNGRYHMFYQYNPRSTAPFQKICWGHAASPDLLHWEDLPLALTPTPGSPDEDGCWSGRAVINDGEVFVLYTGWSGRQQRPCVARAVDDQLVSFQKFEENPVISVEPLPGLIGFRDTAVRRVDGELRQLIGSGSPELGGCLLEYGSKDLVSWEYLGVFLSGNSSGLPGEMWECPDFFELEGRSFLVMSLLQEGRPLQVISIGGRVDGDRFVPEVDRRLDVGSRWYAPQSFDAPDGRRLIFGWFREREEELPAGERGRVGVMSLPRELFVTANGTLGMAPVEELKALRQATFVPTTEKYRDGTGLTAPTGVGSVEVEVEVARQGIGALQVDLLDGDGAVVVEVAAADGGIEVGTSTVPSPASGASLTGPIRVFYDDGIVEVFTGNGLARSEIFYDRPLVRSVAVRGQSVGKQIPVPGLGEVKAWELANVW